MPAPVELDNPQKKGRFRSQLLAWYDQHKRPLPWRKTKDPYKIWLSEVILQQTQVVTGIDYYHRFLKRFPTLKHLSASSQDLVLKYWAGLGYYSRARNFHLASQKVASEHNGQVPESYEDFLALPGVGRYTAGAVLSIAYNKPLPVLDGNVERVLTRLFCITENARSTQTKAKLWELAGVLLHKDRPGDFNQALMELGATLCTPKNPKCLLCPVRDYCESLKEGLQETLPTLPKRKKSVPLTRHLYLIKGPHGILLRKRQKGEWHAGLWDLPGDRETLVKERTKEIETLVGPLQVEKSFSSRVDHTITHHRITTFLIKAKTNKSSPKKLPSEWNWIQPKILKRQIANFPAPTQKLLNSLREEGF